jgi:hypothetical protein
MKKTHIVYLSVTLTKTFEIEANSTEEAEEIVQQMYEDGKILLDASEDNVNLDVWTNEEEK